MFTLFIDLNRGYGFRIEEENLEEFGEYLNECCQRMLTHGNSIWKEVKGMSIEEWHNLYETCKNMRSDDWLELLKMQKVMKNRVFILLFQTSFFSKDKKK